MKIFRLYPLTLDPEKWRQSVYNGEMKIRTISEEEARKIANNATSTFVPESSIYSNSLTSPWKDSNVVGVEELESDDSNIEEILEPKQLNEELLRMNS